MILTLIESVSTEPFVIQEAKLECEGDIQLWHSSFLDRRNFPVSGGFGTSIIQARKIATAEYIERKFVSNVLKSPKLSKEWGCDLVPSACGFAVGFDYTNTIHRSVGEALERWVMSLWIDQGYKIDQVRTEVVEPQLDPASRHFISQFDEVRYYLKEIAVYLDGRLFKFQIAQTMGLKDGGIFPGSSAQTTSGNCWQHSILESYRHLLAFRNNPKEVNTFPMNKVRYFAKNSAVAINQINAATIDQWPQPRIKKFRIQSFANDAYFVARTIIEGWTPWSEGPLERFLY